MKNLAEHMRFYQSYHQKLATKITHMIGIPLVIFSLLIILSWVHIIIPTALNMTVAEIAIVLLLIYYFFLDWLLALAMTAFFAILGFLATLLTHGTPSLLGFKVFLWTFILGWIFQLIGHLIEGKRPALMDNFFQVLIGPIFIMAELFFMLGLKQDLQREVLQSTLPVQLDK